MTGALVTEECDALVAVAPVREAAMSQKADQALVELHALRALGPVGGHRALGALRRDRAGSIGQQQPREGL